MKRRLLALLLLASVGACKPPQPVQQPASRDPCMSCGTPRPYKYDPPR